MVGLGIQGDPDPPHFPQPHSLKNGIHLRWAFARNPDLPGYDPGFPWYGFYLFRRPRVQTPGKSLNNIISGLSPGPLPYNTFVFSDGQFSSDRNLSVLRSNNENGLDLNNRDYLRFTLRPDDPALSPAYAIAVNIRFSQDAEIQVTALMGTVPVRRLKVAGRAGETRFPSLGFDAITAVEISSGPAAVVDVWWYPVSTKSTEGWEKIPGFSYPMCLPVSDPAYPCKGALWISRRR